ncbi:MAG: nucleotidyl transferase AbiEii/AbiGii toxin family protein [Elusimicrobia bacterium]|nr:nucleotidyl transferase AbiEii/AbiGii toxin family protein [Elusimicrobiota bacterium]
MSKLKNVAASVRHRLLDLARKRNRPFDEVLQYYAMERFLYRLSQSTHRDKFILKGALMLSVWNAADARATRDIDLEGKTPNSVGNLVDIVKAVCGEAVENDGMRFDPASVEGERIKEDADYEGIRVRFIGRLDAARATMQIDVAFGDAITPKASEIEYPSLLDMPAPRLKGYPRETVVAEKFQAMVELGAINTRMKDFFDLWLLAQTFAFQGNELAKALEATFARRRTELTADPAAFSDDFLRQKQSQWRAFLLKGRIANAPTEMLEAGAVIRTFIVPIIDAMVNNRSAPKLWTPPGPWK